jgi:hypothetical protein
VKAEKFLISVILAISGYYLICLFVTAILRLPYPFELEWIEGAMVNQVARINAGLSLYVEPSAEYVPSIYMPFYYYVCALFGTLSGCGFALLRFVSLASTVISLILIFFLVKLETRSTLASFIAAAFYGAGYGIVDGWYDIARVDSLFVFFLTLAIFLWRVSPRPLYRLAAMLCLILGIFTKQSAIVLAIPILVDTLRENRKMGILYSGIFAIAVIVAFILLNETYDGWLLYYTVHLPSRHAIEWKAVYSFLLQERGARLFIAFLLMAYAVVKLHRNHSKKTFSFYSLLFVSLLIMSLMGRAHSGGFVNAYMPVIMGMALSTGMLIASVRNQKEIAYISRRYMVEVLILVQFALLLYNPAKLVPSHDDLTAGNRFIKGISEIKGDVWVPFHGYYNSLAGKKDFAHKMAITDLIRADGDLGAQLEREIEAQIANRKFAVIITDAVWFAEALQKADYIFGGEVFENEEVFMPVTGFPTRPRYYFAAE